MNKQIKKAIEKRRQDRLESVARLKKYARTTFGGDVMKIKDFKHAPIFIGVDSESGDHSVWTVHCVLGNLHIHHDTNTKQFYVGIFKFEPESSWLCKATYKTLELTKRAIQQACDEHIQKKLGWLDNNVKYRWEDV